MGRHKLVGAILLPIYFLLAGCTGMTREEYAAREAYCKSFGMKAHTLVALSSAVLEVGCKDTEGRVFPSRWANERRM